MRCPFLLHGRKGLIVSIAVLIAFATPGATRAAPISPALTDALAALEVGRATPAQRALLIQNNDVINRAGIRGWIPDSQYQKAQADYAEVASGWAREAADEVGAGFRRQSPDPRSWTFEDQAGSYVAGPIKYDGPQNWHPTTIQAANAFLARFMQEWTMDSFMDW